MTKRNKYPYGLTSVIGASHDMKPEDVKLVKRLLSQNGHYDVPDYGITPYPDAKMLEGIKIFQEVNGLEVDGIIKPDGPTIETMENISYYTCTRCGAIHGGVYSSKLCHFCYNKLS